MAVNTTRSQTAELLTGMIDGTYAHPGRDRGGEVEPWSAALQQQLHEYGGVPGRGAPAPIYPDGRQFLPF